jgi:AcrR family transcriptional regulator
MDLRKRILQATREILIAHGYDAISMRRIGQAVGVSATTLYLYFESKHALFEALVDEGMELLYERLHQGVDDSVRPLDNFDALCRAYLEFGLENPEYYEIMFVLRPRDLPRFASEKYRRARRNLDVVIQVLQRMYPDATADRLKVLASAKWATLHGTVTLLNAQRIDRSISQAELLDTVVALAMPGRGDHELRDRTTDSNTRLD